MGGHDVRCLNNRHDPNVMPMAKEMNSWSKFELLQCKFLRAAKHEDDIYIPGRACPHIGPQQRSFSCARYMHQTDSRWGWGRGELR